MVALENQELYVVQISIFEISKLYKNAKTSEIHNDKANWLGLRYVSKKRYQPV